VRAPAREAPPAPAIIDFSQFESKYPGVDHPTEFLACRNYYFARDRQIKNWELTYTNWLAKPFEKALKPTPKRPPEKRIALPSSFHELTGESGRACSSCQFLATPVGENGTGQIAGFFCQACGNYDLVELPEVIESQ